MTVMTTLLIFVGIPVGVFLLVAAGVYGASSRRSRRYRPGRPFEFRSVWFLAAPERIIGLPPADGHGPAELPSAEIAVSGPNGTRNGSAHGVKGGASGSW